MKKRDLIQGFMTLLMTTFMFVSCSSKEDQFVGSWSRSFGMNTHPYTEFRAFSQNTGKTFFHTFTFEKGKDGKGEFFDVVSPLMIGGDPDEIVIGSKVSGEWEVKDGKLYLYYNDDIQLTHADNLDPEVKTILEDQLTQQVLSKYKEDGEKGFSYEFKEKNNKTGLEIEFGQDKMVLVKEKSK